MTDPDFNNSGRALWGLQRGVRAEHPGKVAEAALALYAADASAIDKPIMADQVRAASTADIDNDGNVTLAEVVAMHNAGLSDDEMIRRIEATKVTFALTDDQEKTLQDRGVSRRVIDRLHTVNRAPQQPVR